MVIFLLLRMADVFLLLIVPFGTPIPVLPTMFDSSFSATLAAIAVSVVPVGAPSLATPGIICSTLWTTALLVAIWRRQYWARVILVGLLGLATVLVILVISSLTPDSPLFTATLIRGLVTVGCGAYLIYSRDVHRLTSRERS